MKDWYRVVQVLWVLLSVVLLASLVTRWHVRQEPRAPQDVASAPRYRTTWYATDPSRPGALFVVKITQDDPEPPTALTSPPLEWRLISQETIPR